MNYSLVLFIILFLTACSFYLHYHKIMVNKICNNPDNLDVRTFSSEVPGKTVLLLGGIHGNEPAGSVYLQQLTNDLTNKKIALKSGKLIIVPRVNPCGLNLDKRSIMFVGDLNRKFPYNLNYKNYKKYKTKNIPNFILELVLKSDFVVDFHEGYSWHSTNPLSVGSTLSPSENDLPINISVEVVKNLNQKIIDNKKKFMICTYQDNLINTNQEIFTNKVDYKGTLSNFCDIIKKDYILVETTGQNNIQPLELRLKQCDLITNKILKKLRLL